MNVYKALSEICYNIFFLNETHHGEHCIDTAHTFYFAHCHLDVFDKQDEDLNVKLHVH